MHIYTGKDRIFMLRLKIDSYGFIDSSYFSLEHVGDSISSDYNKANGRIGPNLRYHLQNKVCSLGLGELVGYGIFAKDDDLLIHTTSYINYNRHNPVFRLVADGKLKEYINRCTNARILTRMKMDFLPTYYSIYSELYLLAFFMIDTIPTPYYSVSFEFDLANSEYKYYILTDKPSHDTKSGVFIHLRHTASVFHCLWVRAIKALQDMVDRNANDIESMMIDGLKKKARTHRNPDIQKINVESKVREAKAIDKDKIIQKLADYKNEQLIYIT